MIPITISATVNAPIEKVWTYWNTPKHVQHWNFASPDWECPKASNDLKKGGSFSYTLAAKDGSFSFDFAGTYTDVIHHKLISYKLGDNRKVTVDFEVHGKSVKVTEVFDAESQNSVELQRGGWQAILNNFKHYVEQH